MNGRNLVLDTRYIGKERKKLYRFLDTVGDGSGTVNAVGNYATDTIFMIKPFTSSVNQHVRSEIFNVQKLVVVIEDVGAVLPDLYAALTALTNGIRIRVSNKDGEYVDLLDGVAVKRHSDFARLAGVSIKETAGGTNNFVFVEIDLAAASADGTGLRLDGDNEDRLEVVLKDNFTGLVSHYFVAHGEYLTDSVIILDHTTSSTSSTLSSTTSTLSTLSTTSSSSSSSSSSSTSSSSTSSTLSSSSSSSSTSSTLSSSSSSSSTSSSSSSSTTTGV